MQDRTRVEAVGSSPKLIDESAEGVNTGEGAASIAQLHSPSPVRRDS